MEPYTTDHPDAVDSLAGRNRAPSPAPTAPPMAHQRSGSRTPVETGPLERQKVGAVLQLDGARGYVKEEDDVFGPASRTTSGDDYQSMCSSAPTLDSFLSSAPGTPRTLATSTFDEPHSYDGADIGPIRTASLPVKGIRALGPSSRTSSIDSEISVGPGFPSESHFTSRTLWKFKYNTFPIRTTPRYSSPGQSYPRSSLRKETYPPAPQRESEPVIEKDSGLGDETDTMDETSDTCETIPTMPEISPEWRSRENSPRVYGQPTGRAQLKLESPPTLPYSIPSVGYSPDENTVEDICNHILETVFGTELGALDAPSEAWASVSHCLGELGHIVGIESAPMSDSPDSGSSGPNSTSGSGSLPTHGGGSRKRGHSQSANNNGGASNFNGDGPSSNSGDGDDDASGLGDAGRTKKPKVEHGPSMSCPYRKRNPLRFNIRTHHSCACQPYNSMANLKRHVKIFHKRRQAPFVCFRCKESMETEEALEEHVMVSKDRLCEPRQLQPQTEPEDGITSREESMLNDRKSNAKVDNWPDLWRILFPGDEDAPSSDFNPPIELDEVEHEFQQGSGLLTTRLNQAFQGLYHLSKDQQGVVTSRGKDISQTFIEDIFRLCRKKHGNSPSTPTRQRPVSRPPSTDPRLLGNSSGSQEFLVPQLPRSLISITSGGDSGGSSIAAFDDSFDSGFMCPLPGQETVNPEYITNPGHHGQYHQHRHDGHITGVPTMPSFMQPGDTNSLENLVTTGPGGPTPGGFLGPTPPTPTYQIPRRTVEFSEDLVGSSPSTHALISSNPYFGYGDEPVNHHHQYHLGGELGSGRRADNSSTGSRSSSWERVSGSSEMGSSNGQGRRGPG